MTEEGAFAARAVWFCIRDAVVLCERFGCSGVCPLGFGLF